MLYENLEELDEDPAFLCQSFCTTPSYPFGRSEP